MRRAVVCVALLLLASACGGGDADDGTRPPGPRLTAAVARDLDARLREKVEETGVPGATAAVVFPDGRVWSGAAGLAVLEPARPMTAHTSVPFASVTKIATAALALRMSEQGTLALDEPIRRWYPAWRGDPAATVRDLLGHTSGMRDPPDAFYARPTPRGVPGVRRHIAATPRPGPRTSEAVYSNSGFMIAGLVLERAGGRPAAAAMRRELFGHPGGHGLAMQPDERPHPPLTHNYTYPDTVEPVDVSDGGPLVPFRGVATMAFTAGGMAGDVPSLARWTHELFAGRVLAADSLAQMTRFRDGAFWEGYGLGLARSTHGDRELWGHTGDGPGSATEIWHVPRDDLTIAIGWNDDEFGAQGNALPGMLDIALGTPR